MPQLIIHKTVNDFIEYNENYIFENYISHYTLIKFIENRKKAGIKINNAFNIIDDDGSFVLCVLSDGSNFSTYGTQWNNNIISEFSEYANFKNAPFAIHLTGQRALVLELAAYNKFSYEVFKDRLIYECQSVSPNITISPGKFDLAVTSDIESIAKMSYLYHLDEYGKNAQRSPEYMHNIVSKGITAQTFFKWTHNNEIVSIAQVMSSENGYPIIGHFYTKDSSRNKGFGTSLLFSLTQLIINGGHEKCGLISDITNIPSNIAFKKVGYKVIYETISITTKLNC